MPLGDILEFRLKWHWKGMVVTPGMWEGKG